MTFIEAKLKGRQKDYTLIRLDDVVLIDKADGQYDGTKVELRNGTSYTLIADYMTVVSAIDERQYVDKPINIISITNK